MINREGPGILVRDNMLIVEVNGVGRGVDNICIYIYIYGHCVMI